MFLEHKQQAVFWIVTMGMNLLWLIQLQTLIQQNIKVENVIHALMKIIVFNVPDMNLTNVHYVLMDIILIVVRVFNAM